MGLCCSQECRVANFGLQYAEPKDFVTPQWKGRCGWGVFWTHRIFWCIYHVVWIVLSGAWDYGQWYNSEANRIKWFIYLTNWAYLILSLDTLYQLCIAVIHFAKKEQRGHLDQELMPIHLKISWIFFNVASVAGLTVTALFWGLIFPGSSTGQLHVVDVMTHAVNAVYILLDVFIVATPIRFFHVYQTMLFAFSYVIFSLVYEALNGTNSIDKNYIYSVLDWVYPESSNPQWPIIYSVLAVVVLVPLMHSLLFGLYKLRLWLHGDNRVNGEFDVSQPNESTELRPIAP